MLEPGQIRGCGDGTHDWCFDCWVCGKNVRGKGTRFPSTTTPVEVRIGQRGMIPEVDEILTCSSACGASEKAQTWKKERAAQADAQKAAAERASRPTSGTCDY